MLSSAKAVDPVPSLSKPAKGSAFSDPAYKTCVVRATDHAAESPRDFARNDYSRRQAFNADSSRFIVYSNGGHLASVRRALARASASSVTGPGGDAEPQWHPSEPGTAVLPADQRHRHEGATNSTSRPASAASSATWRRASRSRWPSANAAWTKSEGSPSADGRYWCFMVDSGEKLVNGKTYQSLGGVRLGPRRPTPSWA